MIQTTIVIAIATVIKRKSKPATGVAFQIIFPQRKTKNGGLEKRVDRHLVFRFNFLKINI